MDGKIILITGGTGSFGNAATVRLLETNVKEIRIFSRSEFDQEQMRNRISDKRLSFYIGDVRDAASLKPAMHGVNYVFHAAAMKVVPTCEAFPMQAVMTNILGSEIVFQSAIDAGVERLVALSTDKACYPLNAMGISKAMLERLLTAKARQSTSTVFVATRFGNVLSSRGSVIPFFVNQIKSGLPITVTDLKMTRYLLTLSEAVELVLYALTEGKQGDLFVKKAPATTVLMIANALKSIMNADNPIEIIGSRRGEKLDETLVTSDEMTRAEDCGAFYRIHMDTKERDEGTEYTSANTRQLCFMETVKLLEPYVG